MCLLRRVACSSGTRSKYGSCRYGLCSLSKVQSSSLAGSFGHGYPQLLSEQMTPSDVQPYRREPQVLKKRLKGGAQCGTAASPLLTSRYQTSGTSNSDVVDSAAVQERVRHAKMRTRTTPPVIILKSSKLVQLTF